MTLPFDPATLDSDDIGEKRATLHMNHEAAVDHVRETFKAAGFGTATEFSISRLLKEKIGAEREPCYVLGACNPEIADEAMDVTGNRLAGLVPCNVVVWEEEPGVQTVYHVSIMRIARLVGMAPDDEAMAGIIERTGELADEAYANLDTTE